MYPFWQLSIDNRSHYAVFKISVFLNTVFINSYIKLCFLKGVHFILYLCYLYLFTHIGVQHDFHVRWCFCLLTATRRVRLKGHELHTLQDYTSSPIALARCANVSTLFSFCWPLYYLSLDLRLLITPMLSSNFSYTMLLWQPSWISNRYQNTDWVSDHVLYYFF